jgi:hypothetical protein
LLIDPQNVRRIESLVRVQIDYCRRKLSRLNSQVRRKIPESSRLERPDVTKLKLHLKISIAIDRARRNNLKVVTVTQKDLSLAVDVVYSTSVFVKIPITEFSSICCKKNGKSLHLLEHLILFQLFQNIHPQ